jgi:hypothetical protein
VPRTERKPFGKKDKKAAKTFLDERERQSLLGDIEIIDQARAIPTPKNSPVKTISSQSREELVEAGKESINFL